MDDQLIEIKQDIPGFDNFIGSWLCRDDSTVLVDVGPAGTAGRLIRSLEALGLERIDFILLTHVHIDHAGGLKSLLDRYPMARVICHGEAVKFLIEPSKLWKGSKSALGEIAIAYGEPKGVPKEKLIPHTQNPLKDLVVLETPGHAAHHLSFSYGNRLFIGEAGGNYSAEKGAEYLRPATPPRFFFDIYLKSIDRLLDLDDQPIRFGHFGKAEASHPLLKLHRDQILLWRDLVRGEVMKGDEDLINRCLDVLLKQDPNLAGLHGMDPDAQDRERFFLVNSIKGFIGFIKDAAL